MYLPLWGVMVGLSPFLCNSRIYSIKASCQINSSCLPTRTTGSKCVNSSGQEINKATERSKSNKRPRQKQSHGALRGNGLCTAHTYRRVLPLHKTNSRDWGEYSNITLLAFGLDQNSNCCCALSVDCFQSRSINLMWQFTTVHVLCEWQEYVSEMLIYEKQSMKLP